MRTIERKLVRADPAGYEIWRETVVLPTYHTEEIRKEGDDSPQGEGVSAVIEAIEGASGQTSTMDVAYTPSGDYIGDVETARMLCSERGISPERRTPNSSVCSIGFSDRDQKWYGWSHRAIFGFSVGDVAKEGDCVCSSGWTDEYLAEHPDEDSSLPVGFEARTLCGAKRMAVAFAESVG